MGVCLRGIRCPVASLHPPGTDSDTKLVLLLLVVYSCSFVPSGVCEGTFTPSFVVDVYHGFSILVGLGCMCVVLVVGKGKWVLYEEIKKLCWGVPWWSSG